MSLSRGDGPASADKERENDDKVASSSSSLVKSVRNYYGRFLNPLATGCFPTLKHLSDWSRPIAKPPSREELLRRLPLTTPHFKAPECTQGGLWCTWIGHATVLIQISGFSILTDPVFSYKLGPPLVREFAPKRLRPPASSIQNLPNIDFVLVSHNHFDHMDIPSLKEIYHFHKKCHFLVPFGDKHILRTLNIPPEQCHEFEWWETFNSSGEDNDKEGDDTAIKFIFTPSQHWSSRSLADRNRSLWGSWTIISDEFRVVFAGDTGLNKIYFEEISTRCGPIDVAALPIGGYAPREVFSFQHMSPEDAVEAHQILSARISMGIHWGTFISTSEDLFEPPERLQKALDSHNISSDQFIVPQLGRTFNMSRSCHIV